MSEIHIRKLLQILEGTLLDIKTCRAIFLHVAIQNILDFSSQVFGYHISEIVSDIREAYRICYNASPKSF